MRSVDDLPPMNLFGRQRRWWVSYLMSLPYSYARRLQQRRREASNNSFMRLTLLLSLTCICAEPPSTPPLHPRSRADHWPSHRLLVSESNKQSHHMQHIQTSGCEPGARCRCVIYKPGFPACISEVSSVLFLTYSPAHLLTVAPVAATGFACWPTRLSSWSPSPTPMGLSPPLPHRFLPPPSRRNTTPTRVPPPKSSAPISVSLSSPPT
jgi:hypothetical protein